MANPEKYITKTLGWYNNYSNKANMFRLADRIISRDLRRTDRDFMSCKLVDLNRRRPSR